VGFIVGVTREDCVPLFFVIFPLQICGKVFDLRVLLEPEFLR
jgi:hypothetical protein